jgi:hypothetical protein
MLHFSIARAPELRENKRMRKEIFIVRGLLSGLTFIGKHIDLNVLRTA